MFLLLFTVCGVFFGSSAGDNLEEVCYGQQWKFPFDYTPPVYQGPLYFTPSKGGPRKVLMDNGKANDSRLEVTFSSIRLKDVTERDEGFFSVSFDRQRVYRIVTLKVLDCADETTRYYGSSFFYRVAKSISFLEFTPPHSLDSPEILWNRTDPHTKNGRRGQMKKNVWEIFDLTQADNGYYNFRQKDNTLVYRALLTVTEYNHHYEPKVNEHLLIKYPVSDGTWTVIFTPTGKMEQKTLMKAGSLVINDTWFSERLQAVSGGIEIYPVESGDSGTFEFRDPQDNLALTAVVEVEHVLAQGSKYYSIIGGVLFAFSLCCCRYCAVQCCKKNKSTPVTAAAPAAYYQDETQPTGPSYSAVPSSSASHRPVNSSVSKQPATTSLEPPVYHLPNVHMNPLQPEVALPGGQESAPAPSTSSNFLSLDSEPTFELKGLHFLSAPPLSSDSTTYDVYNSDKLNFL